jgi:hypothetical protein
MKPKLARSCWFDAMTRKSLRKTGMGVGRKQHRKVCFWLFLSRSFPPAGASSRVPEAHGHTLGKHLLIWHLSHTDLGPGEMSLHDCQNVMCQCEMLWPGVEGPCFHRPENWLVRQLIDLLAKVSI